MKISPIRSIRGLSVVLSDSLLGGCPTGEAKISGGYRLPARYVIHTVGPVWRGGQHGEDELLAACYRNSLALAAAHDVRTMAFPSISTGVYGFPIERASRTALREIARFLAGHEMPEKVVVVTFSGYDDGVYREALAELEGVLRG